MDLFYGLTTKQKEQLLHDLQADILIEKKDVEILETVKNSHYIGYVEEGTIQIIKEDYNGNRILEEEITEKEIFGSKLSTYMSEECMIIPKSDVKLIIMDFKEILNLQEEKNKYNPFFKNLFFIMNDKINAKNERIEVLTQKTIRNKLLAYLNIQSKKNHSKNIYLPFSFMSLAHYLAVDRSAMAREISYLKKEGFIEVKGKRITLLNRTNYDREYEQIYF